MPTVSEIVSKNIKNAIANVQSWGELFINVKDYGAKGDGVTDDTQAVQSAINEAIRLNKKALLFPTGVYKVTELENLDQVVLFGDNSSFDTLDVEIRQIGHFLSPAELVEFENLVTEFENAEQERVDAEIVRENNETTRISNESIRQSQEVTRETNETIRQNQESNRQTNTAAAIANAETATTNANNAAANAQNLVNTSVHLGEWDNSTNYVTNNEVRYNGSSWRALRDNIGIIPVEGQDWTLVAQRGVDGEGAVGSVNDKLPDLDGNVEITKTDIGLGNVDNEKQATKVEFDEHKAETATDPVRPHGMGTVASRDVQTSSNDSTSGRVLTVGSFGLGATNQNTTTLDFDVPSRVPTGFYTVHPATDITLPDGLGKDGYIHVFTRILEGSSAQQLQEYIHRVNGRRFIRTASGGSFGDWFELWSTANTIVDSNGFIKEV